MDILQTITTEFNLHPTHVSNIVALTIKFQSITNTEKDDRNQSSLLILVLYDKLAQMLWESAAIVCRFACGNFYSLNVRTIVKCVAAD